MQKSVTRFMRDGRTHSPASRDRILFLQGPGYDDRLDGARRIENRATQVVRAEILVSQRGLEFFFDETLDPDWRRVGGQERLPFESLQTDLVYFAEIFEVQLEGEGP